MANTTGMNLTNNGKNLLAKAITGKKLEFTRVLVGDGTLTSQNILTMNNLISQRKVLPIVQLNKTQAIGTAEIICEMANSDVTVGFWVREFGLFAKDPDTNQEILYAYRNVGNEASFFPAAGGIDAIYYILTLVVVIDQAQNVTAIITNGNNYVTHPHLDSRIAALFGPNRDILGFWTYNQDGEKILRPATLQQVKELLLKDYDLDSMNSRINILEDVVAQILMTIEREDLYPDYTHFICEDFYNTNELDLYRCKITSITAGNDYIDCEPISGIIPGSFYMITDGVNQELVQIKSVSIENNIQRVSLISRIAKNYILNSCMLYRTSANILNGMATGTGLRHSQTWPAGITWKGTTANNQYTIPLITSANNANSFETDGSSAFDSSGRATLEL